MVCHADCETVNVAEGVCVAVPDAVVEAVAVVLVVREREVVGEKVALDVNGVVAAVTVDVAVQVSVAVAEVDTVDVSDVLGVIVSEAVALMLAVCVTVRHWSRARRRRGRAGTPSR